MKWNVICLIFFLAFNGINESIVAQARDNITWNSLQFSYPISKKFTANFMPTIRTFNNLKSYQNVSLDYSVRYKINDNWSCAVIGRSWFLPNGNYRQFLWFDLDHSANLSKIFTLKNKLRIHGAFDIDIFDGDFIRWEPSIHYKGIKDFTPFIGYANFFQLNGRNYIERARYKLGFTQILGPKISFNFQYWNQSIYQPNIYFFDNMFVSTLKLTLK